MKEAPEYIYLQMVEGKDNHEATWCQHRIEDTDIQYVRVREEQRSDKSGGENEKP